MQPSITKQQRELIQLLRPFSGNQGTQIISEMKKKLKKCLPANVKTTITYESTKLLSQFHVKAKTKFEYQYNLVYFSKCFDVHFKDTYVGKTDWRTTGRITDHKKWDKNFHIPEHFSKNFKILNSNYRNNIKRKISKALYIQKIKPFLNVKRKIKLNLYN